MSAPGTDSLIALALASALICIWLALAVFGVTWIEARRARRDRSLREAWLARVRASLRAEQPAAQAVAARVAEVGLDATSRLTARISGQAAQELAACADESASLRGAQRLCASRLWWRRLRGMRTRNLLLSGEPDASAMLRDPNAAVRAEAAPWVAAHPSPHGIADLISLLDDEAMRVRLAAADALTRIGREATDAVQRRLEVGPPSELLLEVAGRNPRAEMLPVALGACHCDEAGVRAAATFLLGGIGGPAACEQLVHLLEDPSPAVRSAAAAGLGSLAEWRSASALAELLDDDVWRVRHAAAAALRALGPMGRTYLRRAARSGPRPEAEIARHVMDLPAVALEWTTR